MKDSIFALTKPEQRVLILPLALLAGAFIKHCRDTHSNGNINNRRCRGGRSPLPPLAVAIREKATGNALTSPAS